MARACGLRLGPRHFELVVLDGTAKKPKLIDCFGGDLPPHTPQYATERRAALKAIFKRVDKGLDNLGVALDARGAAFRRQTLPIGDESKVESVLKYEVENQLPQFNIDEVSVDWMVLDKTSDSCSLLVTAAPKHLLAQVIEDCARAGAEPLELELETSAMVNAASSAGLLSIESAQVLVHIGEASTAVAVVDAGKVRELRAIHIGALAPDVHEEAPATESVANETPEEGAEGEASEEALESGEGWTPGRMVEGHQLDEVLSRIQRELARTVSGARTVNDVEAILVCGYDLPGMVGTEVMGVPVEAIEVFEVEDGGTPEHHSSAVAYGAALSRLGGGIIQAKLRRDEITFTGTLERLELPLAVVALLLVTFLGVKQIFLTQEIRQTHDAIASWRDSSNNFMIGNARENKKGNLANPKRDKLGKNGKPIRDAKGVVLREGPMDGLFNYVKVFCGEDENGFRDDPEMEDRVKQLQYIESKIQKGIVTLQKELGQVSDVPVPTSALESLSLVLETFADNMDDRGWRPSFRRLRATSSDRKNQPSSVAVSFDLTFFAESDTAATRHYEDWLQVVEAEPWCTKVDRRGNTPLANGKGIYLAGLKITIDPKKVVQE